MRSPVRMEMFPLITQPGGGSAQPWGQPGSAVVSAGAGAGGGADGSGAGGFGTRSASEDGTGGAWGTRVRETRIPAASRMDRTIAEIGARNLGLFFRRSILEAARLIPMVVMPGKK